MFDESSASGMLLNNLSLKPTHMISLDSSSHTDKQTLKEEVSRLYSSNRSGPQSFRKYLKQSGDSNLLVKSLIKATWQTELSLQLSDFIAEIKGEKPP